MAIPSEPAAFPFFCLSIASLTSCTDSLHYSVILEQKKGKAAGSDGIAMEAFMFGNLRLSVHLSLLFNLF